MTNVSQQFAHLPIEEKRSMLAQLLKDKIKRSKTYPLSFAQERLWFLDQLLPGNAIYSIPLMLRMPGPMNVSALQSTMSEIVRRHEILRTTFTVAGEKPMQVVNPAEQLSLPVVDLHDMAPGARQAEVERLAASEAQYVFDLSKGPLFRATLVRVDDTDHIVLLTMHHIVSDGWSTGVLMREMGILYEVYASSRASPLPELPMQYADFARWQREYLTGETLEEHLAYWREQLDDAPAILEFPCDRPRPAAQTFNGAWQSFVIGAEVTKRLKTLSQEARATLFMTLLAAFKTLIYRYTGQGDVVVGTPIANRNRAEIEGLIGFFVNTLVLRTQLGDDPSFRELLGRVREVTLSAYAYQDLPFEKLVHELQPERALSHSPLFQVMFTLQNTPVVAHAPEEATQSEDAEDSTPQIFLGTAKFDLSLSLVESGGRLSGTFEYNTDLFDHETITRMVSHWRELLRGIAAAPDRYLSALPFLPPAERKCLLVEWNATQTSFPQNLCIHELFEAQAERTPESVAVIYEGASLTYDELNRRANQLAHRLRALGVGPEVRVGICLERSLAMVVGILGILKAGGAYLPLDPSYPRERLDFVLDDSQVCVLLTLERYLAQLPAQRFSTLCLDRDWGGIEQESEQNLVNVMTPHNLVAVFYTSGSTGTPKGSLIIGLGLLNLFHWYSTKCGIGYDSRVLLMTPYTFDASFKIIITPLLSGGVLVLAGSETFGVDGLLETIEAQQVSTTFSTPSLLYPLLELAKTDGYRSLRSLRTLFIGGEPTEVGRLRAWLNDPNCNCQLIHIYGPCECSDVTTIYRSSQEDINELDELPIGKPIDNVKVYVLDRNLSLLPVGIPGELCIAGVGVSRGYLNRPALSAEKFVPNPFVEGERLYRTGDLVKMLPTGDVQFLGRIDHQVKIRGIRIEPGEIETVLAMHPKVQTAVVVARDDMGEHRQLVGYITPRGAEAPTVSQLIRHLKQKLPEHMVPASFVMLDQLPLSSNGKIDRQALPAPDATRRIEDPRFLAPRNAVEEVVAGIWGEVLGLEQIGINDNFFELGGHSLMATQVISRLRDAFQLNLPVRLLFEAATVAELSSSVLDTPGEREKVEKVAGLLLRVARLSDDEVEQMLSHGQT